MLRILALDALILMAIWTVLLPSAAQAYFDFGTGQYLFQLILAFGATIWFSLRRVVVGKPKFSKSPAAAEDNNEKSSVLPEPKSDVSVPES